jgi:hypothetical protein
LNAELFLNEILDIYGGLRFEAVGRATEPDGELFEQSLYAFCVTRFRCARHFNGVLKLVSEERYETTL